MRNGDKGLELFFEFAWSKCGKGGSGKSSGSKM